MRAYIDAQRVYAAKDRDGDGVLQYAQRVMSSAGRQDGLFWPADAAKGEEASPFGPLIAEAAPYITGKVAGDPYRGYYFRILTRQGKNAAGGAYSYVINGRMIAGFAMIAYPASYDETGVKTFIVNHNGTVYERDLGPNTAKLAAGIRAFDPSKGWNVGSPNSHSLFSQETGAPPCVMQFSLSSLPPLRSCSPLLRRRATPSRKASPARSVWRRPSKRRSSSPASTRPRGHSGSKVPRATRRKSSPAQTSGISTSSRSVTTSRSAILRRSSSN
ncbi:MAG: DUF2950 family protein [Betaproteobacteria bacterium]|nr:DUF2950 family protein [Betaproteobacteria bacterium]